MDGQPVSGTAAASFSLLSDTFGHGGHTMPLTDTSTELKVRDATPMGTGRRYLRLKISAAPP